MVVEFLLLLLPLTGLASATVGVSWYSFAKAQLTQIAAEGAMQAAEPDTALAEVHDSISQKLKNRIGVTNFTLDLSNNAGLTSLGIEVPEMPFLGPFALVFPSLGVVGSAPTEN